jgi:hypothetical protein
MNMDFGDVFAVVDGGSNFLCEPCAKEAGVELDSEDVPTWEVGSNGWLGPIMCKNCKRSIPVVCDGTEDKKDTNMTVTNGDVVQGTLLREVYAELLYRSVTNNYFDREHPVRSTHMRDVPVEKILKYADAYQNFNEKPKEEQKALAAKIVDNIFADLFIESVAAEKGVPLSWLTGSAAEPNTGRLTPNKRVSIICCDFDGVLHSYVSGWMGGAHLIVDDPVPGAMDWLSGMAHDDRFQVCVYSSRSKEPGAIDAMKQWLKKHLMVMYESAGLDLEELDPAAQFVIDALEFPTQKPAANMMIDDRAFCFEGTFPNVDWLLSFKPWNKRT